MLHSVTEPQDLPGAHVEYHAFGARKAKLDAGLVQTDEYKRGMAVHRARDRMRGTGFDDPNVVIFENDAVGFGIDD
jgi:hypothetical protein